MEKGVVKWYSEEKGFGFIQSDTDGKEYFVHRTQVQDTGKMLDKGQRVEFEISNEARGPAAHNVSIVEEE